MKNKLLITVLICVMVVITVNGASAKTENIKMQTKSFANINGKIIQDDDLKTVIEHNDGTIEENYKIDNTHNFTLSKTARLSDFGFYEKKNAEKRTIDNATAKDIANQKNGFVHKTYKGKVTKVKKTKITLKIIGRDENKKIYSSSSLLESLGFTKTNKHGTYSESRSQHLYVFPEEEIFFLDYERAVDHAIDLYENNQNSKFYAVPFMSNMNQYLWPDDPDKQELLRQNGFFPLEMDCYIII